jgi:hypothetical protein
MKRKIQEEYIDRILDHANTLQSIISVDASAAKQILSLKGKQDRQTKNEIKCLYLLRSRIKIILPSYISDAEQQQQNLLIPEYKRTNADNYRQLCSFKIYASELSRVQGYDKLIKLGYFNKSNPNGVVKDHRISINTAFIGKLHPEMIGHPCNCEFLTVSENSRKGAKDSLSVKELISLIEKWDGKRRRWREFS